MYLSLIITFLLVLVIIIPIIQNSMPLILKFFTWKLQVTVPGLIFYSALLGGGMVAILTLPKLIGKTLRVRGMKKEIYEMKKTAVELEKRGEDKSD